jgi:hypothetical protein
VVFTRQGGFAKKTKGAIIAKEMPKAGEKKMKGCTGRKQSDGRS